MALRSGRYHNIKHHKDAADQKKAAVIAKMGVLITMAVQTGGGPNPADNPRLRLALSKARAAMMNNEAIERAIKKAMGGGPDGKQLADVTYEGYAPGGVAVVVEALTDNRNRTAPELKKMFEVHGGSIGAPGCVAWQFKPRSVCVVDCTDDNRVLEALLEGGADALDVAIEPGEGVSVIAEVKDHDAILKALAVAKLTVKRSDLTRIPDTAVDITDPAVAEAVQALLDDLDDHNDVQAALHNAVFPAT
ncbi:MAG: YebC/PmpR family DNA-binding transcriptional regulator [Planctomycetes bacterium]|nr:YebC/PmpR family DNA-binding transcriptional regulator [Planctomycetota bacterium]